MRLVFGSMMIIACSAAMAAEPQAVAYPTGYRDWHHVKSMVINPGHPLHASFGGIHHIYANKQAMAGYAKGKFPDGSVASKEEMLEAKKTVVQYNSDMETYLACIKSEFDSKVADSGASADQKAELERVQNQKHNAAVEEVTAVTDRFNEQLRAWKAKTEKEKKAS